ncbi:hypothetical protein [Cyanobium sp. NIES-981]|uniref:hypothetical protein n=1 Tax=Cyanobium sp. NIES-981 TaxID=1851505 RepID=UPI0012F9AFDD|nr:hypothetical protein [Cyanobium sp. NIES-981]
MARSSPWVLPALAVLAAQALGLAAAASARSQDPPYPSQELLRQLQLDTIGCGRENRADLCDKARAAADPLLDHPRLSANCKDALWQIGLEARVAAQNSFQRRESLTAVAADVVAFCRPLTQPLGSSGSERPAGNPR